MRLDAPLAWGNGAQSALNSLLNRIKDADQQEFALDVVDYLVQWASPTEASVLAQTLGGGG